MNMHPSQRVLLYVSGVIRHKNRSFRRWCSPSRPVELHKVFELTFEVHGLLQPDAMQSQVQPFLQGPRVRFRYLLM